MINVHIVRVMKAKYCVIQIIVHMLNVPMMKYSYRNQTNAVLNVCRKQMRIVIIMAKHIIAAKCGI